MGGPSVQVGVRVRPLTHLEKAAGAHDLIQASDAAGRVVAWDPYSQSEKTFSYGAVFGPRRHNEQVFDSYGPGILSAISSGHDATVLMLGRPGTGKSHTLFGQAITTLSDPWLGRADGLGLLPASSLRMTKSFNPSPELSDYELEKGFLEQLSDAIFQWGSTQRHGQSITFVNVDPQQAGGASVSKSSSTTIRVQISMCQVSGEVWTDLLQPYTTPDKLHLKYAGPNAGTFLDGVTYQEVYSTASLMQVVGEGLAVRSVLQPQVLGETAPIVIQLQVFDTELDLYSSVRLIEMGCFESNPADYEAHERLEEVSSLDRYWRTFQDCLAVQAAESPEAKSPASLSRLCHRSSLTYLLEDLLRYRLDSSSRSRPPTADEQRFRHCNYVILGTISPAEHTIKDNMELLKLLDQIEMLTEGGGDAGGPREEQDDNNDNNISSSMMMTTPSNVSPKGRRSTKALLSRLVRETREGVARLQSLLPPTESGVQGDGDGTPSHLNSTQALSPVAAKKGIVMKAAAAGSPTTAGNNRHQHKGESQVQPPPPALSMEQEQIMDRLDGLRCFLRQLLDGSEGKPSPVSQRNQWFFKNDAEVRLPTWHRIGEFNMAAQYNVLNPAADDIIKKIGVTVNLGDKLLKSGGAANVQVRPHSTGMNAGRTSTPDPTLVSPQQHRNSNAGPLSTPTPLAAPPSAGGRRSSAGGARRSSLGGKEQEPLPAYAKEEMRRPGHALILPFLVRIRRDPLCAGRVMHTIYKGETTIGKKDVPKIEPKKNKAVPPDHAAAAAAAAPDKRRGSKAETEEEQSKKQKKEDHDKEEPKFHTIRLRDVLGSPVDEHATINYNDEEGTLRLTVEPGAVVWVNGTQMPPSDEPIRLRHGDVLCIGVSHLFSVQHPKDLLPRLEEAMVMMTEEGGGQDLNLVLDATYLALPMLEPQLSTLLAEARTHLKDLMDTPIMPRPEDLPPEKDRLLPRPSADLPEAVSRMHNATLELLRAQLAELIPLTWEATELSRQMDKHCFFQATVRKHPDAHNYVFQERMPANPLVEAWVVVKSSRPDVTDVVWHTWQFKSRLSSMREMFGAYKRKGKDLKEIRRMYPPAIDPFYEDGKEILIGVAYCYLDSLLYLLEVHECLTIINKAGNPVGELDMDVVPTIILEDETSDDDDHHHHNNNHNNNNNNNNNNKADSSGKDGATGVVVDSRGIMWNDEEVLLKNFMGKTLQIAFHVDMARNIPRRTCARVFVSFKFYVLPTPLSTFRCPQATCDPVFDEIISVKQNITDELLGCLTQPIEVEVWGAPESLVQEELFKTYKEIVIGSPLWVPAVDAPASLATMARPRSAAATTRLFLTTQGSIGGEGRPGSPLSPLSPQESSSVAAMTTMTTSMMAATTADESKAMSGTASKRVVEALSEKLQDANRELRAQKQISKRVDKMVKDIEEMEIRHGKDTEALKRMTMELQWVRQREEDHLARMQALESQLSKTAVVTGSTAASKTCAVM